MEKVVTTRGLISPKDMKITLAHEHVLIDSRCLLVRPIDTSKRFLVEAPVRTKDLCTLKPDHAISKSNLVLNNETDAIHEIARYKQKGGRTIVDVTPSGMGRKPLALAKISEATGVNIVCGTGWYVVASHPSIVKEKNKSGLAAIMIKELTEGIENTGIRAGIIGEIGCSEPLHPDEEKVLRAAACAQKDTGAALTFHPALGVPRPLQGNRYLDILEEEGADMGKVCMSHADGAYGIDSEGGLQYEISLLKRAITIAYDCFGCDIYVESVYPGALPMSDRERVKNIAQLCRQGYDKQILLSQDVCTKTQWTKYGGYGYAHILEHVIQPLRSAGVTAKQLKEMLIYNPRRFLAF